MRAIIAACAMALAVCPAIAAAQSSSNVVVVPPAPAIVAAPPSSEALPPPMPSMPPPDLVQTPLPPSTAANAGPPPNMDTGVPNVVSPGVPTPGVSTPGVATPDQSVPPAVANDWVPEHAATLGVLNKVDGSISQVVVPVGGQATVGDLQVSVQACVSRPAGELPDAAVFLGAQMDSGGNDTPVYHGWIIRSEPGAALVGDASETFRVVSCS